MFTKCVHFLITAFVTDNSSEIVTVVITELGKGYNACTKILTTFTLSKGSVILTGTAKFSQMQTGTAPAESGSVPLWKNKLLTKYSQLCAFTQALEFFLLKYTLFWASTGFPTCIHIQMCPFHIQQHSTLLSLFWSRTRK